MKYSIIIVDDEFLARKLLQDYVSKIESLELAGTCSNATDALNLLQQKHIDIMLVDIHMPGINGMELVSSLKDKPVVIFTTAYSEYAVDAFGLGVTDYLLKPFDFPRFFQAINKSIEVVESNKARAKTEAVATTTISESTDNYIVVKADYKLYKINYEDLLYIEGQHEYVTFHTGYKRITALYSLKNLEENLPADKFIRVHKSFIVSFDKIKDLDKNSVTVAGTSIPVGANYRDALLERLHFKPNTKQ